MVGPRFDQDAGDFAIANQHVVGPFQFRGQSGRISDGFVNRDRRRDGEPSPAGGVEWLDQPNGTKQRCGAGGGPFSPQPTPAGRLKIRKENVAVGVPVAIAGGMFQSEIIGAAALGHPMDPATDSTCGDGRLKGLCAVQESGHGGSIPGGSGNGNPSVGVFAKKKESTRLLSQSRCFPEGKEADWMVEYSTGIPLMTPCSQPEPNQGKKRPRAQTAYDLISV